jgi:GxxExxY protein
MGEEQGKSIAVEEAAKEVVDAAIKVHRNLGPGLLESAYQACLAFKLRNRGLWVECEVGVPVIYEGQRIEIGYRIDMLVANCLLIENKTIDQILPIHEAQLLTYLKLSGHPVGFILNWNVRLMKNGIRRFVFNYNP